MTMSTDPGHTAQAWPDPGSFGPGNPNMGAARNPHEIERQVDQLAATMARIESAVAEVGVRVGSVLHPPTPMTPRDAEIIEVAVYTELGGVLRGLIARGEIAAAELTDLLERIEL